MRSIFDTCQPRDDVLLDELREEAFAARLRDVVDRRADPVYQQPERFFAHTYPTAGLVTLLDEVLGRVSGKAPSSAAIVRLETAFGGGKTHNLIALYHLAHAGAGNPLPKRFLRHPEYVTDDEVKIVGVVGSDLEPGDGLRHGDTTVWTLWGEIAWQLGREAGYARLATSDRDRIAPGTQWLEELVGDQPTLILIDEVARHLRSARAVEVGSSTLAEQTVAALMSLLEFAASQERVVVVLTLADRRDAFGSETEQVAAALAEAKRVSARQERVITPTAETEIAAIVCHRLFQRIDEEAGRETAAGYAAALARWSEQGVEIPAHATRAEYANGIVADYPFHPELLNTLNRKTSTIPSFQKTRGALRLLAQVVRALWDKKPADTWLIHAHHLDLGVDDIAGDLTSRLDRPAYQQVVEADIMSPKQGSPAHAQGIDQAWVAAGKPPYASRVATTVFLHSLTQGTASGVDPADLMLAVLGPRDDPTLPRKGLERLEDCAWYLDWDGRRYRFKTEPSLNKVIADEMQLVATTKAKAELDHRIRKVWLKGTFDPVYYPGEPGEVADGTGAPKLAVVHFDAAQAAADAPAPPELVRNLFDHKGGAGGYREYKNNVLFLVADEAQVDTLVENARRYLALRRIVGDAERLGEFGKVQQGRLRELAEQAELDVRVSITRTYKYLFYPSADAPQKYSKLARETLPAQDQGAVKKDQTAVLLGVLRTNLDKVITGDSKPLPAVWLKSKAWPQGKESVSTEELRKAFARRLGLKILLDLNKLKTAIKDGCKQGTWVYFDPQQQLGFGKPSPAPFAQIGEDPVLYTPDEAARLKIPIKGEETPETCPVCGNPACDCTCDQVCAKCGDDPCTCAKDVVLHGEGAPGQAFQQIVDGCADQQIARVTGLTVKAAGQGADGVSDARSLGLAIPQLGKGEFHVEQRMIAEFAAGETFRVEFSGPWDRYKRLKQITDSFGQEASNVSVTTVLLACYPDGLEVGGPVFDGIRDVLTTLGLGKLVVDAEPEPGGTGGGS